MTPEQKQAVADYFAEADEAIRGVDRHAGHGLEQVGRCIYCSCGLRVGQGSLKPLLEVRRLAARPADYWERHAHGPRPAGDRTPSGQ